jgi:hypothetical protein
MDKEKEENTYYIGVGVGGHEWVFDNDTNAGTKVVNKEEYDGSALNDQIPLLLRSPGYDISEEQQKNYAGRVETLLHGKPVILYYYMKMWYNRHHHRAEASFDMGQLADMVTAFRLMKDTSASCILSEFAVFTPDLKQLGQANRILHFPEKLNTSIIIQALLGYVVKPTE